MKRSSAALRQRLRKRVSVFHLPSPVDCAHLDNNISNGINGERLGALEPMPAFKPPTSRLDRCLRLGGGSVKTAVVAIDVYGMCTLCGGNFSARWSSQPCCLSCNVQAHGRWRRQQSWLFTTTPQSVLLVC